MPKPVKKGTVKHEPGPAVLTPLEPLDPNATVESLLSAYMAKIGAKGGKVSGAKRMEMPEAKRKAIARKGAAARWGKKAGQP